MVLRVAGRTKIDDIIGWEFTTLAILKVSLIGKGKASPANTEKIAALEEEAQERREELNGLAESEIDKLHDKLKKANSAREKLDRDAKEAGRFFNRPDSDADFNHWANRPH